MPHFDRLRVGEYHLSKVARVTGDQLVVAELAAPGTGSDHVGNDHGVVLRDMGQHCAPGGITHCVQPGALDSDRLQMVVDLHEVPVTQPYCLQAEAAGVDQPSSGNHDFVDFDALIAECGCNGSAGDGA